MWTDFDEICDEPNKYQFKSEYESLQARTVITIRNGGDLPAENVRLVFDRGGRAEIKWDDDKLEDVTFTTDLELGSIPIEKSLTATIWTSYSTPQSLTIAHSTGKQLVPIEESFAIAGDLILAVVILLFLIFAFMVLERHVKLQSHFLALSRELDEQENNDGENSTTTPIAK